MSDEDKLRMNRDRSREYRARKAAEGNPARMPAFEQYALWPARMVHVAQPKAVVCCETEAFEDEGAGHDDWCRMAR